MTEQEILNATTEAAKEDIALAKTHGMIAICGTKIGNITLRAEDNHIEAINNMGELLTGPYMTEKKLVSWLAGKYLVEA